MGSVGLHLFCYPYLLLWEDAHHAM